MKKNLSDYIVATGVILCSAVLLAALSYALGGRSQKASRTLDVDFPDVTGIRLNSEVRYAGAPAGSVSKIRLLTAEERNARTNEERRNAVRVSVDIFDGVPALPADVRTTITSDTLLSEKFIALSAGSPDVARLANGALVQGQSSANFDDLLGAIGPILKSVDLTLRSIEPVVGKTGETLDTLKQGIADVMPKLGKVADSAQSTAESAGALLKRADQLIAENEGAIKADLLELKKALTDVQGVLKTTDGFIGSTDKQLAGRMRELSNVLQNLKVVSTQAKAFTQAIGERPHRVIFGGKPQTLTPEAEILRSEKPVPALRSTVMPRR
ncbi:MAG TPA: MlaD family protein [Chthoniobacteraceae bacterium]|jgi:ABC-type transporter Mla subunit MlaD